MIRVSPAVRARVRKLAPAAANALQAFRASTQWQQRVRENLTRNLQWRRPGAAQANQQR